MCDTFIHKCLVCLCFVVISVTAVKGYNVCVFLHVLLIQNLNYFGNFSHSSVGLIVA